MSTDESIIPTYSHISSTSHDPISVSLSLNLNYSPPSTPTTSSTDEEPYTPPVRRPKSIVSSLFSRSFGSGSPKGEKDPRKKKSRSRLVDRPQEFTEKNCLEEVPVLPRISLDREEPKSVLQDSPRLLPDISTTESFGNIFNTVGDTPGTMQYQQYQSRIPQRQPPQQTYQAQVQTQAQQFHQQQQQFQQFQKQYQQQQQQMQMQIQQQIQQQMQSQLQQSQYRTHTHPQPQQSQLNRPRRISATPSAPPQNPPPPPVRQRNASWSAGSSGPSTNFDAILSDSATPPTPPLPGPNTMSISGIPRGRSHSQYQQGTQPLLSFAPVKPLEMEPGVQFGKMGDRVFEGILRALKALHTCEGSGSCSTCWTRDVCALALTCKKWSGFARVSLYENIQIIGADSPAMKKRYKLYAFPRLALLRRSIRGSTEIAEIVKSLKVPVLQIANGPATEAYFDMVATIVMSCPNLERLVGLYPQYGHSFSKLFHALSTREHLTHMDWILEPAVQRDDDVSVKTSSGKNSKPKLAPLNIAPTDLTTLQSEAWLSWHANWSNLTTLNIHALQGGAITPDFLIVKAIGQLPKLKHLFLSNLSYTAFKDDSLLALPELETLSLQKLNGITSRGLLAYSERAEVASLKRLDFRNLNIDTITPIVRLLATCSRLTRLTIVQQASPVIPSEDIFSKMPFITSSSLRFLHWDITHHDPQAPSPTDSILSRSIAAGGFPSLRRIRTPHDPEGLFQALCKVYERVDTHADRLLLTPLPNAMRQSPPGTPGTPMGSAKPLSSPTSTLPSLTSFSTLSSVPTPSPDDAPLSTPLSPNSKDPLTSSNLSLARRLAQARLENARRLPKFFAHVIDDKGRLVEKIGLAGFMGDLQSVIEYDLSPDPGASDAAGGLLDMSTLLAAREVERTGEGDTCSGRWNLGGYQDGKAKGEPWWHVERGVFVERTL